MENVTIALALNRTFRRNVAEVIRASKNAQIARRFNSPKLTNVVTLKGK